MYSAKIVKSGIKMKYNFKNLESNSHAVQTIFTFPPRGAIKMELIRSLAQRKMVILTVH